MFQPYMGSEPYIFISYRHQDSARVLPLLDAMDRAGYRVWYDGGIPWTSEWPAVIAERLRGCAVCAAFHSRTSVESKHCKQEIYYAAHYDKPVLSVYLDDVALAPGTELTLLTMQSVKLYKRPDTDWFLQRLDAEAVFAPCRRNVSTSEHDPPETASTEEHDPPEAASTSEHVPLSRSAYVLTALVYLFLGAGCCAFLVIYLLSTVNPDAVFLVPLGGLACVGVVSILYAFFAVLLALGAPDLYADGDTLRIAPRASSTGFLGQGVFAYRWDFPAAGRKFTRIYVENGIAVIDGGTFRDFPNVTELSLPPRTVLSENAFPHPVSVIRREQNQPPT